MGFLIRKVKGSFMVNGIMPVKIGMPNVRQFGSNDGPGFTDPVSREFVDENRRPVLHGPNVAHTSPGPNIESHVGPHGVPSSNFVQVDQADPGQTSSNVVPLVWPYSSSSLAPCMMTPSLQGEQSPSNTPGSGDELVQSLADVGPGSSNVPTMDDLDSSGDTNVHSHSTLRVSASSDTNARLGSSSDNPAHSNSTLRVSAGDSSTSDG
ncbi:hypothetical protein GOBAR_DD29515 [Gossypium barbadense]|nr:hypothetical protein GOBAR_DD29515 [Gossypium barbadense]